MKRLIKKFAFWILRKEISKHNQDAKKSVKFAEKVIHNLKVGITDNDERILFDAKMEIETERGKVTVWEYGEKIKWKSMSINKKKWEIHTMPIKIRFVKKQKKKLLRII